MSLEYSRGFNAKVYRLSPDSPYVKKADLVRIEDTFDYLWFERLYIAHKIASLLYPDNFIQVVGAANRPISLDGKPGYHAELYSKLAPIPPDHAIFSAHFAVTTKPALADRYHHHNNSNPPHCECRTCFDHVNFHEQHKLRSKATQLHIDSLTHSCISLPYDDPTDYCLTSNGLIFFEIEQFNSFALIRKLIQNPTHPNQDLLVWMLHKFVHSKHKSQTESPNGAFNHSL